MGGALCTVCAYVRSARSTPTQMGRPLSAFPAHTRNHLAHGAKGPKWGSSGGGGICACVGYRGVLGCSDHNPASRSSSRRADHSANCRSIRPWFMTQPACTPSFLDTALAGKCALCSTHVLKSVPEHTPYTTNTLTLSHTLYAIFVCTRCMQTSGKSNHKANENY